MSFIRRRERAEIAFSISCKTTKLIWGNVLLRLNIDKPVGDGEEELQRAILSWKGRRKLDSVICKLAWDCFIGREGRNKRAGRSEGRAAVKVERPCRPTRLAERPLLFYRHAAESQPGRIFEMVTYPSSSVILCQANNMRLTDMTYSQGTSELVNNLRISHCTRNVD